MYDCLWLDTSACPLPLSPSNHPDPRPTRSNPPHAIAHSAKRQTYAPLHMERCARIDCSCRAHSPVVELRLYRMCSARRQRGKSTIGRPLETGTLATRRRPLSLTRGSPGLASARPPSPVLLLEAAARVAAWPTLRRQTRPRDGMTGWHRAPRQGLRRGRPGTPRPAT